MTRSRTHHTGTPGRIVFVGAGPGDPGLLTARASAALATADLVLVDADVSSEVVAAVTEAHPGTELKPTAGEPAEVARTAVAAAKTGSVVVRLVAGDPFTTDAVVKEVLAVTRTSIAFDVVPGVAVGTGVPAYAGVALGGSATFADLRGSDSPAADVAALAAAAHGTGGPLVLQTGAAELPQLAADLVAGGLPGSTPIVVTTAGSSTDQHSTAVKLTAVAEKTAGLDSLTGTVVATVGSVVDKRSKLSWWESRPLFGWRVLVPRTKEQAGDMSDRLRAYGAVPVEVPTIAVEPPRSPAQMDRAVKGLVTGRYGWIVFTSTNAVRAVREKFTELGLDARAFAGVKVACVGEQTAAAVREFGIVPELVPAGEQSSEGLLVDFPPYDDVFDPIDRVLLPRADIATETLAAGLKERGWEIDDVTAYRTVRAAPPAASVREAIKGGGFDAVCFTSSSTVRNLVGIAGKPHARTVVSVIGPATAASATEFGLRVDVQPETAAVGPLVDALAAFAEARRAAQAEGDGAGS
ncbi:bifunctional uroporphyrinogen-III C-methyltransferase/uroporphyrinogen-III synthase [Modestobacter sp. I12A-02628]|uniref:Bifunctional uroporphyrinogen-III C-methyltransferase/uroporphyrinogen-III synthase n=1 Tax=Goekera deserti TaxID=2497753 RepID=A0A7K3W8P6_9ACTN|nr:uroporphyrinogen-III synthase [Goekera deserti]MPR00498.1 bifunctional uroporphyrinogen-III C-methyltransferase/uroporphyrinogen-III synthase [Goekera deserti]NDI49103.1 bifunctional uroporphyrinogen-III C-methyltransferase/uroporphyrinogen-III synthase [Goekera deserti]NEL52841.1 bifunctional uroporphyrinogen-III C-methyltransferase/uroporphyrinogen-III synthase [Goekera deserti]